MVYYIEVQDTNVKDFLQIIQSLKNMGVIEKYDAVGNLVNQNIISEEERQNRIAIWNNFKSGLNKNGDFTLTKEDWYEQ